MSLTDYLKTYWNEDVPLSNGKFLLACWIYFFVGAVTFERYGAVSAVSVLLFWEGLQVGVDYYTKKSGSHELLKKRVENK